jgi:hypothetical protein
MNPNSNASRIVLLAIALTLSAYAQSSACLDVADESHHQLLYSNQEVRVFLLELPRLASTEPHCHSHAYFYVVPGEGRSSSTPEGQATYSRDWRGGEARFVYGPMKHVTRNEGVNVYREIVVESLRQVSYRAEDGNSDVNLLESELGGAKPIWTYSVVRGPLAATKTQLAPGSDVVPQGGGQVLIALTDLSLKRERDGLPAQALELREQEVKVLTGGTLKLTNTGSQSARFVTVEF